MELSFGEWLLRNHINPMDPSSLKSAKKIAAEEEKVLRVLPPLPIDGKSRAAGERAAE